MTLPELEIDTRLSDHYVRLVEKGYDLAIRVVVQVDSSLRLHPLAESERRVVAAPSYLSEHRVPTAPKELERHQCLVHAQPGTQTLWQFTRAEKSFRASVQGRASINHSEATLEIARAGRGICMLASWLIDKDIEEYAPPAAPIRALTPPGRHVPVRIRLLLEHFRQGLRAALRRA